MPVRYDAVVPLYASMLLIPLYRYMMYTIGTVMQLYTVNTVTYCNTIGDTVSTYSAGQGNAVMYTMSGSWYGHCIIFCPVTVHMDIPG